MGYNPIYWQINSRYQINTLVLLNKRKIYKFNELSYYASHNSIIERINRI
jgi:hypothetical protein